MLNHLPHPIFLEILFRIPVNSLVKCTSVSKTWYSLIKSTEFVDAYLQRSITRNTKDPHLVRLLYDDDTGFSLLFESIESNQHFHKQVNIPRVFTIPYDMSLIGYSNGLVWFAIPLDFMRAGGYCRYFLWNPFLHKYLAFPQPNYRFHSIAVFLFDSTANDYKVFAARRSYQVELYSLKNHSWKEVNVGDIIFCVDNERSIFVEGVIYFVGYDGDFQNREYFICGFSIADEIFHKIMLPEGLGNSNIYPIEYGDASFAVVADYARIDKLQLWVMEDGSWIKVLDMTNDNRWVVDVFGVSKGGEVLMKTMCGQVISHDLKSQKWKDLGLVHQAVSGISKNYSCMYQYEDTLALLDKGKDISIFEGDVGLYHYTKRKYDFD